jgi:diguanylate cyclase (GGDEF)-like protein
VASVVIVPTLLLLGGSGGPPVSVLWVLGIAGVYGVVEQTATRVSVGRVHLNYSPSEIPLLLGALFLHPAIHVLVRFVAAGLGTAWRIRKRTDVSKVRAGIVNGSFGACDVSVFGGVLFLLHWQRSLSSGSQVLVLTSAWLLHASTYHVVMHVARRVAGDPVQFRDESHGVVAGAVLSFVTLSGAVAFTMSVQHQISLQPVVLLALFGSVGASLRFLAGVLIRSEAHRSLDEFFTLLQVATHDEIPQVLVQVRSATKSQSAQLLILGRGGEVRSEQGSLVSEVGSSAVQVDGLPKRWVKVLADAAVDVRSTNYGLALEAPRTEIVCPLIVGGHTVGLLICSDQLEATRVVNPIAVEMASRVAAHLSMWLEQDRLLSALRSEMVQRTIEALHDPLTGLLNRRGFGEAWTTLVDSGVGHAALFAIDLDNFSDVNSFLGHTGGDHVLAEVGVRLRSTLPARAILARLGGDEFVVCLPGIREGDVNDGAYGFGKQIRKALAVPHAFDGKEIKVGGSVGIALYPDHGTELSRVQQCADAALYAAKEDMESGVASQGLNRYIDGTAFFDNHRLKEAIDHGDIVVYYQPIIDVATMRVAGFETLARWQDGDVMVMPSQFIPVAERSGHIHDLTAYIMGKAFPNIARWQQVTRTDLHVAVNFSPLSIANPVVLEALSRCLQEAKLRSSAVHIEVTESRVLRDPIRAAVHLQHLQTLGVKISLDDFGTGHSSFEWLLRLGADQLKIDRVFIRDVAVDEKTQKVVALQKDMAASFNMTVVAEGIETVDQWTHVRDMGITYAQGYLFGRPMPAHEIDRWLIEEAPRLANTLALAASMPSVDATNRQGF